MRTIGQNVCEKMCLNKICEMCAIALWEFNFELGASHSLNVANDDITLTTSFYFKQLRLEIELWERKTLQLFHFSSHHS